MTGSAAGLTGGAGDLVGAGGGMKKGGEHAAEGALGVGDHFFEIEDEGAGDAFAAEGVDPGGGGFGLEERDEERVQRIAVADAEGVGGEVRMGGEFEGAKEGGP